METNAKIVRCLLLLSTVYGVALCAEWCTNDFGTYILCAYGCCGINNSYCCSDSWGSGSIAGTVVGIILFCLFVALIVVCCRRRYHPPAVVHAAPASSSVAVVTTQQTMATQMQQPYPGQYPPQYPGQPGQPQQPGQPGMQQPPPYKQQ